MISARERQVLKAWDETDYDMGYLSFARIAVNANVPPKIVRRTVRALARKGLTVYGKGLWNDDGEVAGAGYAITDEGRKAIEPPPPPTAVRTE